MEKSSNRADIRIIILIILSIYLFFFQLGGLALTDPDETFYAQTAKEMLRRGEWLTPHLYGKPQFEKPILFYWLVEASFKLFGVNEFAARFPSAVFGLIGIIALYLLGGFLFNKRVGALAGLILATSVEYIILSRACVTDMVLGTFILLGILFFFYADIKGASLFYILSSAAFALAVLTKGPIGILLPGIIIISYLLVTKDFKIFKNRIAIFWAIVVFFAVSLPWYLIMYKLHGKDFIGVFFGFHNITRFLEAEHKAGAKFYYYIPIVFGGLFPWSAFLPFGFLYMFKRSFPIDSEEKNASVFLVLWFSVIFIFFSVSSTRLPTYIFPSFAALALMIGRLWDDFLQRKPPPMVSAGTKLSYYLLLAAMVLGAIGFYIFINFDYPTVVEGALIAGAFLIFGIMLSFLAFINKKFAASFFFITCSVAIFLYPLDRFVLPEIERYESCREISQKLFSLMKPGEDIGAEKDYVAGVTFYTDKMVTDVDRHHLLVQFLSQDKRVWCVLKEKNHIQLYTLDTKPYYMKTSYMVYKLGKKCIVTNKIPDDGVYLVKRERSR